MVQFNALLEIPSKRIDSAGSLSKNHKDVCLPKANLLPQRRIATLTLLGMKKVRSWPEVWLKPITLRVADLAPRNQVSQLPRLALAKSH